MKGKEVFIVMCPVDMPCGRSIYDHRPITGSRTVYIESSLAALKDCLRMIGHDTVCAYRAVPLDLNDLEGEE